MQESKNMDIEAEATAEQSTTRASVNDPGYISVSKNVDLIKDKIKRLQGELTPENLKVVSWKIANASKRKKKMARQSSKLEKRQMLREGGSIGNKAFILVQKLQQLKDLRRQRLKKEGHFFPEEDEEFFQRVRKAEEAQVILENIGKSRKDKQPKQHDSTGVTAVSQTLECEPMVNVKRKLSEAMAVDTTVTKLDSVDPTSDSQAKYRKVSYVQQDLKVDTVQDQEESEDQRQFSREQVKIKEDPSTLTNRTRPPNVHDQPKRPIPIDPALIQPSIEKKEARLQKNRKIWEVYQVFPKMGTREAKRASSVSVELEEPPDTPSSEAWIKFLQSGKFDALHVS
ncbi:hypothetical protein BGZ76_001316 [Entomortierella beljakovae]|nr:hypothetical protein BGZ76_001316 [Entomortierella beljakovae]